MARLTRAATASGSRSSMAPDESKAVTPPEYENISLTQYGETPPRVRERRCCGMRWGLKHWIALAVAIVAIVVIIVAVGVAATRRKQAYPDYTKIKYKLAETYGGETFFDKFNYFTGYDPAQGFVHYVPQHQAQEMNLTFASPSSAVLRVDTSVGPGSEPDASTGRFSVRLESKHTYDRGLFIFDVLHTPYGCGAWPALWLTDPSHWPDHGEIDVMEATNHASEGNQMTLHTTEGCRMSVKRKQQDKSLQADCDSSTNDNAGCGVQNKKDSMGQDFNAAGGGVMAMEWRDEGIRMWQFARDSVPTDITGLKPDPSTWGTAAADFPSTECDIGHHFKNNSIILNIDLCGPMVYGAWKESTCPGNCTDIVANQPDAFKNAYWEVGSFYVYQAS